MAWAVIIISAIAALWLAGTVYGVMRYGLGLRHAFLFAPLRMIFRVDAKALRETRTQPGTLYVVGHQSRLEPAIMLSLLPESTLHVLDDHAAASMTMEPYRALGRTIRFNPGHVFFSRRLVRHLKGKGQLAVYVPEGVDASSRGFSLYRAVARIAHKAEAKVVVVHLEGAERSFLALEGASKKTLLPKLTLKTLPPRTIAELMARSSEDPPRPSLALLARMREVRGEDGEPAQTVSAPQS